MKKTAASILVLCALLSGCTLRGASSAHAPTPTPPAAPEATPETTPAPTPPASEATPAPETSPAPAPGPADALMSQMTLREKVGQLFIIRPDSLDLTLEQPQINDESAEGVTELTEAMAVTLRSYPVGGVVIFGKNITGPEQIMAFVSSLQSASGVPLFIAADEEGGSVARLAGNPAFDVARFESPAAVGASGDAAQALEMGAAIGEYLSRYGFNLDFAPVADVTTNPDNPVLGSRAFSSDASVAAAMASSMAEGLRSRGVIPTFKHFPGHGDTTGDSHNGLAITYRTKAEMLSCEWLPFLRAGGRDCIMVGHISVPGILGDLTLASMSPVLVADVLRGELGFEGLVITDSLAMRAVTDQYAPGEAAVAAILAGCDMILMPNGLREAFDGVLAAVEDGTISEARLDESVRRVLELKLEYGIISAEN